jgi:hypothetical protein
MKLPIFFAPLIFLIGASAALGDEVSFAQPADSRNRTNATEKYQEFDEEWLNAELLAYDKRYEAEKTREEARKVGNTIIIVFTGVGIFLLFAKWWSLGGRKERRFPRVFLAIPWFIGAIYFCVVVYYGLALGYTGTSSKAGISIVSRDREPFLFYLNIYLKAALAAILLFVSHRKAFQKKADGRK